MADNVLECIFVAIFWPFLLAFGFAAVIYALLTKDEYDE